MRTLEDASSYLQPEMSTAQSRRPSPVTDPSLVDNETDDLTRSESRIHASLHSFSSLQSEVGVGEPAEIQYEVIEETLPPTNVHKDWLKQHMKKMDLTKEYQVSRTSEFHFVSIL